MSNSKEPTATIDPDREWTYAKNLNYDHLSWYSTPDGAFEKRVSRDSRLDEWSGFNWNKVANQPGEYYGSEDIPRFNNEWNEEEYYRNWTAPKTNEQVAAELHEPIDKLEEKYSEFTSKGEEVLWTPTLARMVDTSIAKARQIEYEISPFFQLNKQGFRKNWANVKLYEMRPITRLQSDCGSIFGDFMTRFQLMRWNLGSRIRLRYMKVVMVGGAIALVFDHSQSREYRRRWKWH